MLESLGVSVCLPCVQKLGLELGHERHDVERCQSDLGFHDLKFFNMKDKRNLFYTPLKMSIRTIQPNQNNSEERIPFHLPNIFANHPRQVHYNYRSINTPKVNRSY